MVCILSWAAIFTTASMTARSLRILHAPATNDVSIFTISAGSGRAVVRAE
jgi:uncharacterized protein YqgV (UPF0045/DUF77 family)